MHNIIIDDQFKELLPLLDAETFAGLEANIIQYGVRDPIVLWNNILIDGYNRYSICIKHDIPFHTVSMEFPGREEVISWIIWNQIIRRNLTPIQRSYYCGLHYHVEKAIVNNQRGRNQYSEDRPQNGVNPQTSTTARKIADMYGVSRNTIQRNAQLSTAIDKIGETSPEAKRKILSGEVKINKSKLERFSGKSTDEVNDIITQIENDTYDRRKKDDNMNDLNDEANSNLQDTSKMSPFEAAITKISGELFAELQKQAKDGDKGELKAALRSYITMLEDLYQQI